VEVRASAQIAGLPRAEVLGELLLRRGLETGDGVDAQGAEPVDRLGTDAGNELRRARPELFAGLLT
jgi:hypothetical protein